MVFELSPIIDETTQTKADSINAEPLPVQIEEPDFTDQTQTCDALRLSKNETEWNAICDKVKVANSGYPSWWFPAVVLSGLAASKNF